MLSLNENLKLTTIICVLDRRKHSYKYLFMKLEIYKNIGQTCVLREKKNKIILCELQHFLLVGRQLTNENMKYAYQSQNVVAVLIANWDQSNCKHS